MIRAGDCSERYPGDAMPVTTGIQLSIERRKGANLDSASAGMTSEKNRRLSRDQDVGLRFANPTYKIQ